MSALRRIAEGSDPELRRYAVERPGPGRFESAVGDADRALVLETVREGFLMHYGEPRAFAGMDPDLRLLAGDALYAQGLARLAELGDLEAVAELADLISLCAWAESEGRDDVAAELWEASAQALDGAGQGARAAAGARLARGRDPA